MCVDCSFASLSQCPYDHRPRCLEQYLTHGKGCATFLWQHRNRGPLGPCLLDSRDCFLDPTDTGWIRIQEDSILGHLNQFWTTLQSEVKWMSLSCVRLFATPWNIQSLKFSRQEYWSGQPFPSPGDLLNPRIEPRSPTLQVDYLPAEPQGKPKSTGVGSLFLLQGNLPDPGTELGSPVLQADSLPTELSLKPTLQGHLQFFWLKLSLVCGPAPVWKVN